MCIRDSYGHWSHQWQSKHIRNDETGTECLADRCVGFSFCRHSGNMRLGFGKFVCNHINLASLGQLTAVDWTPQKSFFKETLFKGVFGREWPYSTITALWCDATEDSCHVKIEQSIVIHDKCSEQTNKQTNKNVSDPSSNVARLTNFFQFLSALSKAAREKRDAPIVIDPSNSFGIGFTVSWKPS